MRIAVPLKRQQQQPRTAGKSSHNKISPLVQQPLPLLQQQEERSQVQITRMMSGTIWHLQEMLPCHHHQKQQ
jgi:hypothetical protein